MKLDTRRMFTRAVAAVTLFCVATEPCLAALLNLAQEPLIVGAQPAPKVMLTISKDQQLYKKAYNDYTDLDADGVLDLTYKHSIEYYGYFDPTKCYSYDDDRFEPKNFGSAKDPKTGLRLPAYCNGNQWSGNFLNWVTMSRMDAVRKIFYGGLRSTDEPFDPKSKKATETVLERSYIPADAHAWAKWYNGSDLKQLTPFDQTSAVTRDVTLKPFFVIPATAGFYNVKFSSNIDTFIRPGDQVKLVQKSSSNRSIVAVVYDMPDSKTLTLKVSPSGVSGAGLFLTSVVLTNLSSSGTTFCNVTLGSTNPADANSKSQTNTNPPLIRTARGNFALWNANERVQCLWGEERSNMQKGFAGGLRANGNQAALSGIDASAESPFRSVHATSGSEKGEYIARVQVCVDDKKVFDAKENKENCKRYPSGNLKPIGVLQEKGDLGDIHFGLMTGSHARNVSGGVLRKNPGPISDEVNVNTDGTFKEINSDGKTFRVPYRPRDGSARTSGSEESPPGIINTLNYMRIYGYRYADTPGGSMNSYLGPSGDNCTYQLTSVNEDQCTSWGNPMSEVFFEAVRYFAANDAQYTYKPSGSKDNELGLPLASFNKTLLTKDNYCANLNVLVVNASVSDNEVGDAQDLRVASGAPINAKGNLADLTNKVGDLEKITGNEYFIGKLVGGSATPASDPGFELCTAKKVTAFGDVSGICPEGPTLGGSYLISGLAYHAKTNRIRTDLDSFIPATDSKSLKVTSYGIQLATNTPSIEIPGANGEKVTIQPIYRLNAPGGVGGGGLVDLRYVNVDNSSATRTGKVYVNWEDSEQGGDYDQDMWGTIEWSYDTKANKITITTNAIAASTGNPQGFGYSISGTTQDGPHFHSGIYNFNYPLSGTGIDSTGAKGCVKCNLEGSGGQTGAQSQIYTVDPKANTSNKLNDPLWYMAKYGAFEDKNNDGIPNGTKTEWDTSVAGTPDTYFLVTNPIGLAAALSKALSGIKINTAGSSAATNSTSLQTIDRVYQARFDASPDWSGQLISTKVDSTGKFLSTGGWDAGLILNTTAADKREIITYNDDPNVRDGAAFRPGNVKTLDDALDLDPATKAKDGRSAKRLTYLRGDTTDQAPAGPFRQRLKSVLGDIVNSDPAYVGFPNATRTERSFADHQAKYFKRPAMLYVGANDGMLHGFDANTGQERMAYVPSKTFANLNLLTDPNYQHRYFVDGSPAVDEIQLASDQTAKTWRTTLVGSLGLGGQGLFALDVTDPSTFDESNASKMLLWEFTDKDDPDLGYVLGKPVIRKFKVGKGSRWAAIVSAGYNNDEADGAQGSGRAALFVIFLDGPSGAKRTWVPGTDYVKIDTKLDTKGLPNGLAPPFAADVDADGIVDFVYAGDLQGNFWKFDVTSTTPADWALDQNRTILFTAKDPSDKPQPITSQAEGTLHPNRSLGGFILTFGTGKFLEKADAVKPFSVENTYYGIWDKNNSKGNVQKQSTVSGRSVLQEQVISESGGVRTITANPVDWASQMGWFIDFKNSTTDGERMVFRPLLLASRLIFTTLIPAGGACESGGRSFIMIVDPATGGRIDSVVLDLDRNGILNSKDQVTIGIATVNASGVESKVGVTPTPVVVRGGVAGVASTSASRIFGTTAPYIAGAEAALGFTVMNGPGGLDGTWIGLKANGGRVSWREIVN